MFVDSSSTPGNYTPDNTSLIISSSIVVDGWYPKSCLFSNWSFNHSFKWSELSRSVPIFNPELYFAQGIKKFWVEKGSVNNRASPASGHRPWLCCVHSLCSPVFQSVSMTDGAAAPVCWKWSIFCLIFCYIGFWPYLEKREELKKRILA